MNTHFQLLNISDVRKITTLGTSSINRLSAEGAFPPAIHFFAMNRKAWIASEVNAWLEWFIAGADREQLREHCQQLVDQRPKLSA